MLERRSPRSSRLEAPAQGTAGQDGDGPSAARRLRILRPVTPSLLTKDLSARRILMLGNVRGKLGLRDLALVGRSYVKERQPSLASESVAGEDAGEDHNSIDVCTHPTV